MLGSAVALHLLFPASPLLVGGDHHAFDVLLLLSLQRFGMRLIEAVVLVLIATIGVCYFIEIFVLPQTQPNFPEMGRWLFAPDLPAFFRNKDLVYLAIGIIGATVMPHNLYLHSALVQTRKLEKDEPSVRRAVRYNTHRHGGGADRSRSSSTRRSWCWRRWSSYGHDQVTLPSGQVVAFSADADWIQVAYVTLAPLLGHGRREPALRRGAAGERAEQHDHGHAGRAGRDGGIHALADRAVGAPADHAAAARSSRRSS